MKSLLFCIVLLFIPGLQSLTCPENEVERRDCPRLSEGTCAKYNGTLRVLNCKSPECYCKPTYVREEFTKKCYHVNECPNYSFILTLMRRANPFYI